MADEEALRLQVFLARSGIGSRRTCEEYIREGRVRVNGETVSLLGTKIDPQKDEIRFDGEKVEPEQKKVYIALNKPAGYLCTNYDEYNRSLAGDLVQPDYDERLFHVGRLDYSSRGIIFYTNDGIFSKTVSHPSEEFEKEYIVTAEQRIPKSCLEDFRKGITVGTTGYRCEKYTFLDNYTVSIVLIEGKNREIRKVFDFCRIPIRDLRRIRLGCVTVEGIPEGRYRELSDREIAFFVNNKRRRKEK